MGAEKGGDPPPPSPPPHSTKKRDQTLKRRVYGKYGIPEYWVVHPQEAWAEVLTLREGEDEPSGRVAAPDGVLRGAVFPDVAIPLGPIFAPL